MKKFKPFQKIQNKKLRIITKLVVWSIPLIFLLILLCDNWVKYSTKDQLYSNLDEIPHNRVGIVLGTSKHALGGRINLYYQYRIEAAAKLFHAHKIDYIVVSGDNSKKEYNESKQMKESLIEKGVPADRIQEDFAGLRTLDSVLRMKEVFGENYYTIISQPFHNERALFLSNYHGHHAIAFNAQEVPNRYGIKTEAREYLARVKAVLDLYILKTKAKFYGEKIPVG